MENTNTNTNNNLKKEEIERYCRQIILPEIGPEGQEKLSKAKVLVIGAGGLGSSCLLYLAGAGVGEIGIVDGDSVDTSNLHRQIIHMVANKGINKAKSAELLINAFNPLTKVNIYEEHLSSKNVIQICRNYDLLIDCSDNPATRYLTNDICVLMNKPLVSGSAVKWEGQLTVYVKDSTSKDNFNKLPCYRCLFPLPTPTSAVCSCSEGGVFGPVPGVIGTLQANEAIKLILGASDKILAKRMMIYDAYEMTFKVFKLRNSKDNCRLCGSKSNSNSDQFRITLDNIEEFDYLEFVDPIECRVEKRLKLCEENNIKWIKFLDLLASDRDKEDLALIDVRPREQYNMFTLNLEKGHKFVNIPFNELKENFEQKEVLLLNKEVYFVCRAGNHSTHATRFLLEKGFQKVFNIEDGIHGYINEIDSKNTPFY